MIRRRTDVLGLQTWGAFLGQVRAFFNTRGFTEVTTPHLVEAGAFEAVIDPLRVSYRGGKAELHTSPEIEMKALLAETPIPIFQVCHCFRDDPPTGVHFRDFMMLEYYRPHAVYHQTRQDIRELVANLAVAGEKAVPLISETRVEDLVLKVSGIDLRGVPDLADFHAALKDIGVDSSLSDSWADLFFRLMIERIEPSLDPELPVLLYDYPPAIAALARRSPQHRWAEKFELYWKGMELCNGCTELDDADELRQRHQAEEASRREQGLAPHPFSERLWHATGAMPKPTSGVAVGLDRLFACLYPEQIERS